LKKISIVLPTHNGARYLAESLHTCLNQTYRNIEVIVVDDGSTDSTSAILAGYADPRLIVCQHSPNRGLPEALNTGFGASTGDYLTWTSDDNLYDLDAVASLATFLDSQPHVDFVYSDYRRVDELGQVREVVHVGPPSDLLSDNPVGYCFMYRRSVYEVLGEYDPRTRLAEDFDYWVRVATRFTMERYSKVLYSYREHAASLTSRNYGGYEARRVCARARRRWLGLNRSEYARQVARANIDEAFARYAAGDLRRARGRVVAAAVHEPRLLCNRGVISILVQSMLGAAAVRLVRKARGWRLISQA
jgi:glycosyltransferase involved in cell wall biosynthesis